ncbi:MAG: CotH kinase family protein, partial [Verrucomicrobiales bacterium]|nr:CotH kinase family protein [Verrucomicrobiales bacterium]
MGNRFPKQSYFHTYGRDAAGNLGYFPESTPGRPNPTSSLNSLLTQPEADLPTGFYPGHVTVTLSKNNPLGTVRYTTDGSDPTETNGIDYTAPINTSGVRDQAENEGDPGGVLREIWTAVPGTSVSQIPTDTTPDFIFNTTALSTPPDWTDNYGDRFRGFLRPPVTGDYSFWIASGDSSELWLSPTNNSAEKQLIASVPNRTNSRQWDKFPSQHSIPIRLETGKSYYFESLRKAGTGIDHLAVSWDGPGIDRTVIFGDVIAPVNLPNTTTNSKSMTIKARTFAPGHVPSTVTTRSYLINHDPRFAENHALLISGDPSRSLFEPNGATAIVGGSNSGTWNPTNPTTDYNMAMEEGRPYERPVFFEYIEPGGSLGFSNGGAVRIAGSPHARPRYNFSDLENNNWLGSWTTKPSLNFFFRDELGNATVNYPLFGADRVSTFTDFRLRAGKNDSANPFIRDEVLRRLSGATGQPASRGIFLNLFINGHFKAYFNLTERLRERFFQEHHNSSDGWDIWHIREIVEGDRKHYDSTMNLLRTGNFNNATTYAEAASRVDLTSYIDYIIVNAYGATGDWPHNNYNIARERSETGKWHFNVWDAEGAFGGFGHGINWNTFSGDLLNGSRQSDPHMTRLVYKALRTNPEFRLLFADRIQKHFFNDGGLTQESIRDIYIGTRDEFAPILRLARNQAINESFFNNWWPGRRRILFSHFESQALWPNILPPNFSKLPGEYPVGTRIFMADINSTGTVHFTTDGSDPRATGGAVTGQTYDGTPVTLTNSLLIKARSRLANGSWSPLREILFTTPQPPALVISEIHYNPEGTDSLEFVELKNIGTAPIGLDGLTFSAGIKFTFSSGTVQPGGLLVIVKDPDAFTTAHPEIPIAGTFTGSLDNAGERLTLSEPGGRTVFSVGYNDKGKWPSSADGDGFSLVLSNPADPDSPSSWRSGAFVGGTPGSEPFSTFAE